MHLLIGELAYDSGRPFDLGHAWPMFAVSGGDAPHCAQLAESLVGNTGRRRWPRFEAHLKKSGRMFGLGLQPVFRRWLPASLP